MRVAATNSPASTPSGEYPSDVSTSASPDLLSDRDTAEATYQVVRGLAGG
jgi:hypothetical protein